MLCKFCGGSYHRQANCPNVRPEALSPVFWASTGIGYEAYYHDGRTIVMEYLATNPSEVDYATISKETCPAIFDPYQEPLCNTCDHPSRRWAREIGTGKIYCYACNTYRDYVSNEEV